MLHSSNFINFQNSVTRSIHPGYFDWCRSFVGVLVIDFGCLGFAWRAFGFVG
jgi:hypothetical protein